MKSTLLPFTAILLLLTLSPTTLSITEYNGKGNYTVIGQGSFEFIGKGHLTIKGINMKLCLRQGTIINRTGNWYNEDDCMETRKGTITLQGDKLDFYHRTQQSHIKGIALFKVFYSGRWTIKKK